MSLLDLIGLSTAYAADAVQTAAPAVQHPQSSVWSMMLLPLIIILVFYFLLIRPQQRRAKEHQDVISRVSMGDEVLTSGGIVGRVTKLRDNFIVLDLGKDVTITLQRNSIASVLPKGTMDSQ